MKRRSAEEMIQEKDKFQSKSGGDSGLCKQNDEQNGSPKSRANYRERPLSFLNFTSDY